MLMGNYLRWRGECTDTMATDHYTGGLFHVTVVPENFDPDEESSGDDDP